MKGWISRLGVWAGIGLGVSLAATASDREVELQGTNSGECGYSALLKAGAKNNDPGAFLEAIQNTNWDPSCLPEETRSWIERNPKKRMRGFAVGLDIGLGPAVGYSGGREFVVVRNGPDTLEVATLRYDGISASLSLPIGASFSQSVLLGSCDDIASYLGYFATGQVAGMVKSIGLTAPPIATWSRLTGCNSVSLVTGASTNVIGFSTIYFRKESETVQLSGPRIKELLKRWSPPFGSVPASN